jgi:hypothetical protein
MTALPPPRAALFYDPNTGCVQVWYSLRKGRILAHLHDRDVEYVGAGVSYAQALRRLEHAVPLQYQHTINYMRVMGDG